MIGPRSRECFIFMDARTIEISTWHSNYLSWSGRVVCWKQRGPRCDQLFSFSLLLPSVPGDEVPTAGCREQDRYTVRRCARHCAEEPGPDQGPDRPSGARQKSWTEEQRRKEWMNERSSTGFRWDEGRVGAASKDEDGLLRRFAALVAEPLGDELPLDDPGL